MKREAFYLEIGDIDDDLIQAANETHRQKDKMPMVYRIAGIAACLCLICGSFLFGLTKDTIYINESSALAVSKAAVPVDENTNIVPVTSQALFDYYGIAQLPDAFGETLIKSEQSYFVLYQDQNGHVVYDTNVLYYSSIDRSRTLSVTFAKAGKLSAVSPKETRQSRIDGVSMVLAASSNDTGRTAYRADFELRGVSVQMLSDGMNEEEFISAVKEFIRFLK